MITIIARCEGDCRKIQTIEVRGQTLVEAKTIAGLMDGTSPVYVFKPGKDSEIGKCASCGGQFKCEVVQE